jgi:FkbM family methyltransferase
MKQPWRPRVLGEMLSAAKRAFRSVGLEVAWRNPLSASGKYPRSSLLGLLEQAREVGFSPRTVVDVGAAYGSFALACNRIYPTAKYVLLEPLREYETFLKKAMNSLADAEYIPAAVGREPGEATMNVHPDLVGSSVYLEEDVPLVNGVPRRVRAVTLDEVLSKGEAKAPFLVKVDVQGAEVDVLIGGTGMLENAEYVLLEVSLFEFFKGAPQFHDVLGFMKSKGFVPYDLCGLQYRTLDRALSQVDVAFVKENGIFRRHHYYATPEQRVAQYTGRRTDKK